MTYSKKRSKKRNINRRLGYKKKRSNKLNRIYKQYGGANNMVYVNDIYVNDEDVNDESANNKEENMTREELEKLISEEFLKPSNKECETEEVELKELLLDYEDDIATLNRLYEEDLLHLEKITEYSYECSEILSKQIREFNIKFFKGIENIVTLAMEIAHDLQI